MISLSSTLISILYFSSSLISRLDLLFPPLSTVHSNSLSNIPNRASKGGELKLTEWVSESLSTFIEAIDWSSRDGLCGYYQFEFCWSIDVVGFCVYGCGVVQKRSLSCGFMCGDFGDENGRWVNRDELYRQGKSVWISKNLGPGWPQCCGSLFQYI